MKLAHLVHMSEEMAVVLAAHEEEHLRECGMWYGGWEVDERDHDVRSRNKLYFELKDEFFWWYVSMMRGRQGGPLCESPGCARWADLSDTHPCNPCFCCSVCASAMKESRKDAGRSRCLEDTKKEGCGGGGCGYGSAVLGEVGAALMRCCVWRCVVMLLYLA